MGAARPAFTPGPPPAALDDDVARRARQRAFFRRLAAPVWCRPAGLRLFARHRVAVPSDVAKIRIYSDEPLARGDRLDLELVARGGAPFVARITWVEPLEARSAARFDVGLTVERIDAPTAHLVRGLLR